MTDVEVKTHSNEVIDMAGQVLQSKSSITFTKKREGDPVRPDKVGSALIQARHMFNDLKDVTDEVTKLGMDGGVSYLQDTKYRFLKVHYYAYGLFWSTLMKAMKGYPGLKEWSPELFKYDVECEKCKGLGRIPLVPGTPAYEESYKGWCEDADDDGKAHPAHGIEIAHFCSPCQGVGFIFDRSAYQAATGG